MMNIMNWLRDLWIQRRRTATKAITQASDAGLVTGLTVTGVIWVEGITLVSDGVAHANLTAIVIQKGNDLNSPVWIDATLGAAANLNVADESVVAAAGTLPARLVTGDTIGVLSTGTGSGATAHKLHVTYRGETLASVLA